MSDVVLEIYSENGGIQVLGDGGIGFGLAAADNLTLTDDGYTHPQPMVTGKVTVTGTNPILAFSGAGQICVERMVVNGSTFTWNLRAQSSRPIGVQWWVFDTAAASIKDASMADLEAAFYDQYGVTTFDAAASVMRIKDGIATPKTPSDVPFGGWSNLEDTTNFSVPAGKVYAIVQSTPAFVMTTYDTGSYGTGQYPPEQNFGDGEPPLGMNWRYQNLESYQATGGYIDASTIQVGLTRFEFWPSWNSRNSTPFINVEGQARHMIVDVTNFLAAGAPNPSVVVGSVNATSRSVTTGGSAVIASSTTPSVTASATGGASPYSYLWQYVRGSNLISANGSATSAIFSTKTLNQDHSTTREAVWRCRITDANGIVGYSPEVTFIHIASNYSIDVVPDPVSFSPITINSPDPDVAWVGTVQTITGITQAITLRVERYSYSGNLDGAMVDVVVRDAAGVEKFNSYFDAKGTGLAYLDVTVQNGWSVGYYAHAVTNSGRKSGSWQMVVWNLSNPGGSVQISSQPVSAVVDNDDNFNIPDDFVPTAVNWANISGSTNDASFYLANPEQTISGVNKPIVIRATISNVVKSSNIVSSSRLDFQRNGAYVHDTSGIGNGFWTQATLTSGQVCRFIAHAGTSAGTGTLSYTVTVTNQSTGGTVLDTFTVNQTVDADNNHNVAPTPDYTPNAISVGNLSLNTNEPSGLTNASFFQITGINQQITVQFTRGNQWDSGGIFTRRLYIYHSKTGSGGPWTEYFIGAGAQGVANIAATNGDWFYVQAFCDTTAGIGQTSFNGYVTNATTGVQMASYLVSATVDANNDYNVVDYTPDALGLGDLSISTNSEYGSVSQSRTITGINQAITIRATVSNISGNLSNGGLYVQRNGANIGNYIPWVFGAESRETTFSNGDSISFYADGSTTSGKRQGQFYTSLTNVTTGQNLGGFWTYVTVDANNDYNLPAGGVTPRNWEDISHGYTSNNGSSSTPNYRLGGAQSIAGLASGQTATISLTATADGSAMAFVEVFKNGVNQGTKLYSPEGSTSVQTYPAVTVQNGDTIAFRCGVGGRLAQSWEGTVWQDKSLNVSVNASPGGLIDTFSFYGSYSDSSGGGGGGPIEM